MIYNFESIMFEVFNIEVLGNFVFLGLIFFIGFMDFYFFLGVVFKVWFINCWGFKIFLEGL